MAGLPVARVGAQIRLAPEANLGAWSVGVSRAVEPGARAVFLTALPSFSPTPTSSREHVLENSPAPRRCRSLPRRSRRRPAGSLDDAGRSTDLSGRTDASIRNVLSVVSRHQLRPLKDADYIVAATPDDAIAAAAPDGVAWNYPWGVTLYGALRSTDVTHDREVEAFVLQHNEIVARDYIWLAQTKEKIGDAGWAALLKVKDKVKIAGLMRLGNLDNCGAMGTEFIEGMLRHPESVTPEQKAVVDRIAGWIVHGQERLPDGTFWRPNATDINKQRKPGTLWIDDLYMGCPFLVRWAKYTGDYSYLHDAAQQVIHMAARLQDTDGVWYHAYFENEHDHSPFKWGRANGWAMVATVEVLSALPENHQDRAALLDIFKRQVNGIRPLQTSAGLWRQLLDKPEVWEETSATAMFAYSIARAVNRGWLPAADMAVARKAFMGLCTYVTPTGSVNGTSEGTNIGLDAAYYINRKRPDDDLHGRGVLLLAGTEILAGK